MAFFTGNPSRMTELLGIVPDVYEHNVWVLAVATYESLWVAGDLDLAERRLAAVIPRRRTGSCQPQPESGDQRSRPPFYSDRAGDADYAQPARAAHGSPRRGATARSARRSVSSTALTQYGFYLQAIRDFQQEITVLSEAIEISEHAGAWFTVDVARVGLVEAISQVAGGDPGLLAKTASTLRATVEAALKRRNHVFVAEYLGTAVERVLWFVGDRRTAVLLGTLVGTVVPAARAIRHRHRRARRRDDRRDRGGGAAARHRICRRGPRSPPSIRSSTRPPEPLRVQRRGGPVGASRAQMERGRSYSERTRPPASGRECRPARFPRRGARRDR